MAGASKRRLEQAHRDLLPTAAKFGEELRAQLQHLLDAAGISVSSPVIARIKDWRSVSNKISRHRLRLADLLELKDLIGLRIIVQFSRDAETVCEMIAKAFQVLERQDVSQRLRDDQFGYGSTHFVIRLPDEWLQVPTLQPLRGLQAEIQVRTTAQHIWASASHRLQYKRERFVPPSIRRSIHRLSAILELVDLELERVLALREEYRKIKPTSDPDQKLDVDVLEKLLDELLPVKNKGVSEDYDLLAKELEVWNVLTVGELVRLVKKHLPSVLRDDRQRAEAVLQTPDRYPGDYITRAERAVYFYHDGLVRSIASVARIIPMSKRHV